MEPKKEPKELKEEPTKSGMRRRNDRPHKHLHHVPPSKAFCGDKPDLRGWVHVYDSAARANQYDKTTEAIAKHVKKTFSFSRDIWKSMLKLQEPNVDDWMPSDPKNNTKVATAVFNEKIKRYVGHLEKFEDNREKAFTMVLDQCDEPMRAKLEGQPDWDYITE